MTLRASHPADTAPVDPSLPPVNVVPIAMRWAFYLAKLPDTVLMVGDFRIYPTGFSYAVESWLRPGTHDRYVTADGTVLGHADDGWPGVDTADAASDTPGATGIPGGPATTPTLGLGLPLTCWLLDAATHIESPGEAVPQPSLDPDPCRADDPRHPRQRRLATGGGPARTRHTLWVYPLPLGQSLDLVYCWPQRGIRQTCMPIDLAELMAAGKRCEVLW